MAGARTLRGTTVARKPASRTDLLVIASAKAKPGKEGELEQALREVAPPTRAQPGCVAFDLYRRHDDPAVIIGFEHWSSKEHHDLHLKSAHVQKLMSAMADILAESPQIASYEVLDE